MPLNRFFASAFAIPVAQASFHTRCLVAFRLRAQGLSVLREVGFVVELEEAPHHEGLAWCISRAEAEAPLIRAACPQELKAHAADIITLQEAGSARVQVDEGT